MRFVDLHIHSRFSSDGEWEVEQILRHAASAGAGAISISDHDSLEGVRAAVAMMPRYEFRFIPSVEITTVYCERDYHLLAPMVDPDNPGLIELLAGQSEERKSRAAARVEKLQECGFDVDYETIAVQARTPEPTGPAIARALLDLNRPSNAGRLERFRTRPAPEIAFYQEYFEKGKPAYSPLRNAPLEKAISVVRRVGGVPTLAHPGASFIQASYEFVQELADRGLQGLEVHSSYHDAERTATYAEWARHLNLVATAGSDFHGRMKPHVGFGSMKARGMELVEELESRQECS